MTGTSLLVLELIGIAAFAATGALVAVRKELDIFGALVLGMTTGLGGGVVRDVLVDANPPTALDASRYLVVSAGAAVMVFLWHPSFGRRERQIDVLDAVGVALFCVVGATIAHDAGLGVIPAALLGLVSAVGGGMIRDVLAGRVPVIFRDELYATPAFAGALIAAGLLEAGVATQWTVVGSAVCLIWRLLALWRGWKAPLPPGVDRG